MNKTALDLTPEEWRSYQPDNKLNQQQDTQRWEQAWELAQTLASLLRQEFGARRVVVFGSLVHRDWFEPYSDIDLAAWGISSEKFYQAVAAVTGISKEFEVDLVDMEYCSPQLQQVIEQEGIEV